MTSRTRDGRSPCSIACLAVLTLAASFGCSDRALIDADPIAAASAPTVSTPPAPDLQSLARNQSSWPSGISADERFDFEEQGADDRGWLRFLVTIRPGGSPAAVAMAKFTPLFSVEGQDAATYVSGAFFRENPTRGPTSIQPGDSFVLTVPPETFVVGSYQEHDEGLAPAARLAEYTSIRGDVYRRYLADPFPVRYETVTAASPSRWTVHLHPDLPALAGAGRTDATRLARLLYRVPDPDILQIEEARLLLAADAARIVEVDRTQRHLDQARQFDDFAVRTGPVPESGRGHLLRRVFPPDQGVPFMAVEDATGTENLGEGLVVRVEYRWNGSVRVVYRTGPQDTKGKRDPYQARENERWAALYSVYGAGGEAPPVKWGEGAPSDFSPFPSARDPWQRGDSHDFLVSGRYLVLSFEPTRFGEDDAETSIKTALDTIRNQLRSVNELVQAWAMRRT